MTRKNKDELIDNTSTPFGIFEEVEELKSKYDAFVGWRTIYESGGLQFIWNRGCSYGRRRDLEAIEKYLGKMLKRLGKWARSVGPASEKRLEFGEYFGDYRLEGIASPRASYGYVYLQIGMKGKKDA